MLPRPGTGVMEREPDRPPLVIRLGWNLGHPISGDRNEGLPLSEEFDRRAFLKHGALTAAGLGLLGSPAFLAACSASKSSGTTASPTASGTPAAPIDTLRIPFLADMQVPDPDIFYEGEGLLVTLSAYEGLVRYTPAPPNTDVTYQPVAKRISPALATSWDISPDGLTYTFHLRSGVKFHDGTTMDAESWRQSFVRRAAVGQGPAYMMLPVASTSAPDPLTFVVVLKHPVDPFLDYMACNWSPKAVSPALIAAHTVGNDLAQKWISTNDAGTGPYRITEFIPSDHYTLEVFPDWWGPAPEVKKIILPIIPDIQTQELKFKNGELDMMTKGLPIQDIQTFEKDSKYRVEKFGLGSTWAMFFNPTKGRIFEDINLRQAVRRAVNKPALVGPVFKDTATLATQTFPAGTLPDGASPDSPPYDPSILTKMSKGLSSNKVDLAYGLEGGAVLRLMGELVQTQLQAAGLNVTVRSIPTSQEFALTTTPDSQRPDILLDVDGPDAIHVDTNLRIYFRTGAAPLNWFGYSFPAADQAMDEGSASTTQAEVLAHYAAAANVVRDSGIMLSIANQRDVIVSRAGITNFVHDPMLYTMVRVEDLRRVQ
jgi:peptide/nickel transport system substrate-binding protein